MNVKKSKKTKLYKKNNAFKKLIKLAGSQSKLGKMCNVSQQTIFYWLQYGVPAERVIFLESLFDGVVARYELRPDLYLED